MVIPTSSKDKKFFEKNGLMINWKEFEKQAKHKNKYSVYDRSHIKRGKTKAPRNCKFA